MNHKTLLRQAFCLGLVLMLVVACSASAAAPGPTPTSTPTPIPAPPTNVDGEWSGKGTTAQGKEIGLSFTVKDNALTSIMIGWYGATGDLCGRGDALSFALTRLPIDVVDYTFVYTEFGITGTFKSNFHASGFFNYTDDGLNRSDCKGTFQATWEAKKTP